MRLIAARDLRRKIWSVVAICESAKFNGFAKPVSWTLPCDGAASPLRRQWLLELIEIPPPEIGQRKIWLL
jgi:hypothetical protein